MIMKRKIITVLACLGIFAAAIVAIVLIAALMCIADAEGIRL